MPYRDSSSSACLAALPFFTVPGITFTLYLYDCMQLYGPHTGTANRRMSSGRGQPAGGRSSPLSSV